MSSGKDQPRFITTLKHFPPVINDKIDTLTFLEASRNLVIIIEKLGKLFSPVTRDMLGNIEKLNKYYSSNTSKHETIQDMILSEQAQGQNVATDALLWLNRAIHFMEVVFMDIVNQIKTNNIKENLKDVLTNAYSQTLKQYHGWMGKQLFSLISRMCPSFSTLMKSFECEKDMETFAKNMENLLRTITSNRMEIINFYSRNKLQLDAIV